MSLLKPTLLTLVLACFATAACAKPPPKSIEELRAADRDVELIEVGDVDGGVGFSAKLYRYESAGLKIHALVARPDGDEPDGGWPVVIANHGHHPDPPNYGVTAEGKDHRPGDYYRRIPELFVARGYLVVMPDYRGHNNSEGFEYTHGLLESPYYTEDVLNLLAGLDDIAGVDLSRVFMWGHSMGGEVTLRALLATNKIKAASMWSSVGGSLWDQAYYYSRYEDPAAPDSSETDKTVITRLRRRIADLDADFSVGSVDPLEHLDHLRTPIIIQHAIGDRGAAYKWSEQLANALYLSGKRYEFWTFDGDEHLFPDDDMGLAADRDHEFFQAALEN